MQTSIAAEPGMSPLITSYRMAKWSAVCLALFFLVSCSAVDSPVDAPSDHSSATIVVPAPKSIGPRPEIIPPGQIHWLDESQKQAFLDYFHHPMHASQPPHRRMVRYLDRLIPGFEYSHETHTASEAVALNRGNCLTLAIVTASLAQLAGLDYGFQLMEDQPVFALQENAIQKGVHIRTRVMNPEWTPGTTGHPGISPGITIDYFSNRRERFIRNLHDAEYLEMYYRNLAVEAPERNDLTTAFWLTREALHHAPQSSASLNMLAVVTRRAGEPDAAEAIYLHAIEHAADKLTLLKNYRLLLLQAGRHMEAAAVDRTLENMEDPSPFNWYHLARSAAEDGDHRRAIGYYSRTLKLAPYLHEAMVGMAQSYYQIGDRKQARASLMSAISTTGRVSTQRLYKAKLNTFYSDH